MGLAIENKMQRELTTEETELIEDINNLCEEKLGRGLHRVFLNPNKEDENGTELWGISFSLKFKK